LLKAGDIIKIVGTNSKFNNFQFKMFRVPTWIDEQGNVGVYYLEPINDIASVFTSKKDDGLFIIDDTVNGAGIVTVSTTVSAATSSTPANLPEGAIMTIDYVGLRKNENEPYAIMFPSVRIATQVLGADIKIKITGVPNSKLNEHEFKTTGDVWKDEQGNIGGYYLKPTTGILAKSSYKNNFTTTRESGEWKYDDTVRGAVIEVVEKSKIDFSKIGTEISKLFSEKNEDLSGIKQTRII
jgi:hypothetical protein